MILVIISDSNSWNAEISLKVSGLFFLLSHDGLTHLAQPKISKTMGKSMVRSAAPDPVHHLLELFLHQNPAQLSAQVLSHSAAQGLRSSGNHMGSVFPTFFHPSLVTTSVMRYNENIFQSNTRLANTTDQTPLDSIWTIALVNC